MSHNGMAGPLMVMIFCIQPFFAFLALVDFVMKKPEDLTREEIGLLSMLTI